MVGCLAVLQMGKSAATHGHVRLAEACASTSATGNARFARGRLEDARQCPGTAARTEGKRTGTVAARSLPPRQGHGGSRSIVRSRQRQTACGQRDACAQGLGHIQGADQGRHTATCVRGGHSNPRRKPSHCASPSTLPDSMAGRRRQPGQDRRGLAPGGSISPAQAAAGARSGSAGRHRRPDSRRLRRGDSPRCPAQSQPVSPRAPG